MHIEKMLRTRGSAPTPLSENVIDIDHIAVAVEDLPGAIAWATNMLGCDILEQRETHGRNSGMKSTVLRLGGLVIVLVQGTSTESQVTQFVKRHGPGVQHLALRVRDIGQAITDMSDNGMKFSTPRLDSERLSQIFSLRDPSTGLMIELIERRNYAGFSDENVQRLFDSLEQRGLY